jgi:hypothetical protein
MYRADFESQGDYFFPRETIFFPRAKHTMRHFEGFFEEAETFLTPKLS